VLDSVLEVVVNLFAYNQKFLAELQSVSLDSIPTERRSALRAIASFVLSGPEHLDARMAILGKIGAPAMMDSTMQSPLDDLERIVQCELQLKGYVSDDTLSYCYRLIFKDAAATETSVSICRSFRQRFEPLYSVSTPTQVPLRSMANTPIRRSGGARAASPPSSQRTRTSLRQPIFPSPSPVVAAHSITAITDLSTFEGAFSGAVHLSLDSLP